MKIIKRPSMPSPIFSPGRWARTCSLACYYKPKNLCEEKQRITIRNLLQMQAGFDCFEMPGFGPHREVGSSKSKDKVAVDFDIPILDESGATWRYCSGCTLLPGVALEPALAQTSSVSLKQYLGDRLKGPLHITNYSEILIEEQKQVFHLLRFFIMPAAISG
jgi:hypothetical protein